MLRIMKPLSCFALALCALPMLAPAQEKIDYLVINRIKTEAFQNGKVMEHLFYLTDVYGARLAGSPNYKKAGDWAVSQLKEWGLENPREEKWGPFGRSWQNVRCSVHMTEPTYSPLISFALAWSNSTEGVISGEPINVVIRTEAEMEKWKGKLKGKIVFTDPARDILPVDKAFYKRYTDQELADIEMQENMLPPTFAAQSPMQAMMGQPRPDFRAMRAFRQKLAAFWREEGVAVLVGMGYRNDGGTMAYGAGGSRDPKEPLPPAMIDVTPEQYNRIVRLLEHKIPVKVEIEVKNEMSDENADSFNVIAEIPGGRKKDEIVMIGGHLDSWNAGTGATDNAAGSAVMLEVVRILKKLDLKMDRTVRIGLWAAEEEGLLGSRAYVKEHYADRETMKTTAEWDKFDAYYNVDNGGGKIRGIYTQGNDMVHPIFEAMMAPFKDLGVSAITNRNTGGTDHQAFDAVGLPGFQFIQDPLEYETRTHHSNMDVYDRIQKADMQQMAAIVAAMVYETANREEKLPRKPKPEPRPATPGGMGF
jgi:carboxypeptidase Q